MGGSVCNTTLEKAYSTCDPDRSFSTLHLTSQTVDEEPMAYGMTFHHMGLIVGAIFAIFATLISGWLMFMHATHYSKPYIQKQ